MSNSPLTSRVEAILRRIAGMNADLSLPRSRVELLLLAVLEEIHALTVLGWMGETTTPLVDGSTTNPINVGGESKTAVNGNITSYEGSEFIFNGTEWQEFGPVGGLAELNVLVNGGELELTGANARIVDGQLIFDSTMEGDLDFGRRDPLLKKWIGITTTALTDGATTNPIIIHGSSVTAVDGDVAAYDSVDYIFNGTIWQEYGRRVKNGTISIPSSGWSGDGPYHMTVTVDGATVTNVSKVSLQLTPEQTQSIIDGGVIGLNVVNNYGVLTMYAYGFYPPDQMTIACTVEEWI